MKLFRQVSNGFPLGPDRAGALGSPRAWMVLGLSRAECSAIQPSNFQDWLSHAEVIHTWEHVAGAEVQAVAVLASRVAELFPASAAKLFSHAPPCNSWVTVLLPWLEPPRRSIRADGEAESFCCSPEVFRDLVKAGRGAQMESLCFRLLKAILDGIVEVRRVLVRQLPLRSAWCGCAALDQDAALIMAHRGPKAFLVAALRATVAAAGTSQVTARVGLDIQNPTDYQDVVEAFPQAEFYNVEGAPVGPYVVRQSLIDRSAERLVIFHDSDDISCYDRFAVQAAEISERGMDTVGSHELRVDELAGSVGVYRFPLDASAALALPGSTERNDRANEPLLHPTLTMVRSSFVRAGGFSTNRKIANDTQFMLRAFFSMRMRNVDQFLYIRRRHSGALTVANPTALGTPRRHFLGTMWGADFEAVKSGRARLEETSLRAHLSPVEHGLRRIWPRSRSNHESFNPRPLEEKRNPKGEG